MSHRIPVKRRDQLGDLAVSFNAMTESVAACSARWPRRSAWRARWSSRARSRRACCRRASSSSGPLSVWAHFRPAAEVGGDYFDLFPLAPGRLVVAIGDVAGHGLPTGLLMAMVKSAVATLVEEG